jgi:flavin reductase (DIM6/NTAB) family NADH-FMN oxidoreductase RutF
MKKSIGSNTMLYPLPAVVIGSYDENNKPNIMTASWAGIVNSHLPMVSVSLRKATYSYENILKNKAFTISIPSKNHLIEMDYIGTKSGARENKFDSTGLTPESSDIVQAPYVSEFPLVLECKLIDVNELGLHAMFLAEIKDVKIDEEYIKENGIPDILKLNPIAYAHGEREYYELGSYLGKANKLWQSSLLNKSMNTAGKKEVMDMILKFYSSIDESKDLDTFDEILDWDNFRMINGDSIVDSYSKFDEWYEVVKNSFFDRKHIIERINMDKINDKKIIVSMDMYFRAKTWTKGHAYSSAIEARSKITWTVSRESESGKYKLSDYLIEAK